MGITGLIIRFRIQKKGWRSGFADYMAAPPARGYRMTRLWLQRQEVGWQWEQRTAPSFEPML